MYVYERAFLKGVKGGDEGERVCLTARVTCWCLGRVG